MKRLSNLFNRFLKPGSSGASKDDSTSSTSTMLASTAAEQQMTQFLSTNRIPSNSLVSDFVWELHSDEKPHRSSIYITATSVIFISELTFAVQVILISNIKQIHTALHSFEFVLQISETSNPNPNSLPSSPKSSLQQSSQANRFYFCSDSDRIRQSIIDGICSLSSGMKIRYCDTKSLIEFEDINEFDSPPISPKSIGSTNVKLKKQPSSQGIERGSQLNFEDFEMLDQIGAQDVWRYFRVRESRVESKKIFVMRVVNIQALRSIQSSNQHKEGLIRTFIEQQIALIKILESSCYFLQQYYYIHAGNHFAVLQEELTSVEYRNLSYLLERQSFIPENVMVIIAGQLAHALNLLHEKGIVYRQVNAEDVKIDMIGSLILSRFEFCRIEYLSPEMILGKGHSIATDWWSFGIILYEMLIGFVPFADLNAFKMMEMILFEEFISFPAASSISEHAKNLITQCLNKNDKTRIQFSSIQSHPFFANLNWTAVAERVPQREVITFMTQLLTSNAG